MKIAPATQEELIDFLQWYWREVQGKPYQTTSEEIVNFYLVDKNNSNEYLLKGAGFGGELDYLVRIGSKIEL